MADISTPRTIARRPGAMTYRWQQILTRWRRWYSDIAEAEALERLTDRERTDMGLPPRQREWPGTAITMLMMGIGTPHAR